MKKVTLNLNPKTKKHKIIAAGANLNVDIQYAIIDSCDRLGITRSRLARKVGVKTDDINKIFSEYTVSHLSFDQVAYMLEILEVKLQWKTKQN